MQKNRSVPNVTWHDVGTPNLLHSLPDIWSSDIWSFRVFGQFFVGPEQISLSYNRKFRIYGLYFGYMVQLEGNQLPELGPEHLQHVHVLRPVNWAPVYICTKMEAMEHFLR